MPRRTIGAIIFVLALPLTGECRTLTVEMTTAKQIGPNTRIMPSARTLDEVVPNYFSGSLIDAIYSQVGHISSQSTGTIDLGFKLTFGSQVVSQTAPLTYYLFDQSDVDNAANLLLKTPTEFNFQEGTITLASSSAAINLLNYPAGTSQYSSLFVSLRFTPVPEPSSCALLILGAVVMVFPRQRPRIEFRCSRANKSAGRNLATV
jgi:hypothetical protein